MLVFTDGDDVLLGVPVLVLDVLLLAAEVSPVEWVLQSESVHCLQEFWERSSPQEKKTGKINEGNFQEHLREHQWQGKVILYKRSVFLGR